MSAEKNNVGKVEECQDPLFGGKSTGQTSGGSREKLYLSIIAILVLILVACGIIVAIVVARHESLCNDGENDGQIRGKGAVVSDHGVCSQVGRDILSKGGSAVDAAIATLICNGAFTPHSMGIGGGCFMVIYDRKSNKSIYIDGRETGPSGMTAEDFYKILDRNSSPKFVFENNARRVGIPGELKAYRRAHDMYGRLPWSSLFEPTIEKMEKGMVIRKATYTAMVAMNTRFKGMGLSLANFTTLCEIFCADTTTGEPKKAGEIYYWPKYRQTLMGVAEQGPNYLYNGPITETIVQELKARGSKLEVSDFTSGYNLVTGPSLKVDYGDYSMYTIGRATGGPVVAEILNILEGYNFTKSSVATCNGRADTYHKMIEALKFSLIDKQLLEDPDFGQKVDEVITRMVSKSSAKKLRERITPMTHEESYYTSQHEPEKTVDMGTSHLSVLGPEGDAVSVTSTINWYFGSMEMSESTGILWNNEMNDFSSKTATTNVYAPGKRPRSSMVPAIVVDKEGNVRFVVGGSGGTRILTSVAQIINHYLSLRREIPDKWYIHRVDSFSSMERVRDFVASNMNGSVMILFPLHTENHWSLLVFKTKEIVINILDPVSSAKVEAKIKQFLSLFKSADPLWKLANKQIIAKMIWLDDSLQRVIDEKRFHYQWSKGLELENGFDEVHPCVLEELLKKNHTTMPQRYEYMSVIESIYVHKNGTVEDVPDERKLHRPI